MSAPTHATTDGRAYLDLRKLARDSHRPVDELLQLYVLEAFLARLSESAFSERLILKGGVLLAAFDERRPTPDNVLLPRLLGGELSVRGYPLAMVHAEKIVTAITRGTVNTRWRDFADIYMLSRHHPVNGNDFIQAVHAVAEHRHAQLRPLAEVLTGFGEIGQQR